MHAIRRVSWIINRVEIGRVIAEKTCFNTFDNWEKTSKLHSVETRSSLIVGLLLLRREREGIGNCNQKWVKWMDEEFCYHSVKKVSSILGVFR